MKRINKSRIDKKHFEFIRELPCLKCPSIMDIECSHVSKFSDRGTALKASPWFCVPQCRICHRRQHDKGELTWWNGEDGVRKVIAIAKALYEITGDVRTGTQIVIRGRREIWV